MEDLLVREARRRRRVFEELDEYLERIVRAVRKADPRAEVYLFGSVADGSYTYSSDIDVLVVTHEKPEKIIALLWEHGIEDPFEIHVVGPESIHRYKARSRLIKVG